MKAWRSGILVPESTPSFGWHEPETCRTPQPDENYWVKGQPSNSNWLVCALHEFTPGSQRKFCAKINKTLLFKELQYFPPVEDVQ